MVDVVTNFVAIIGNVFDKIWNFALIDGITVGTTIIWLFCAALVGMVLDIIFGD